MAVFRNQTEFERDMIPSLAALRQLIEQCGLSLTEGQYDQLWRYHRMLRAANPDLNHDEDS